MSLPSSLKRRIISLSQSDTDHKDVRPEEEYDRQKRILKTRYQALSGLEKCLVLSLTAAVILVVIQFFWIAALQYEVALLKEEVHTQQTRLTQLEQASQKHNNLLYSTYESMEDLNKKWHDLHFRVLENTWKLGN
ncbi:hypothetical protein ACG98G_06620 [Megasphaera hexanoica]|uniref:Cell division protein FtsL n=1 Tax=Megasphaera hexanoica TaxID=1675036 RepID=A0A848BTL2_9FIRM|nr:MULTISPECIES: hypothetical protein [Megasphaera]MCI5531952.1 hypothetical protein [Caecibacter massiliensis]AXB80855.1 hypothetical protein ACT01_00555 [Megasphaera hexanoica]KUH55928.1 hypothetical protein AT798_04960 [Megasphaera sp. DJF_B143]MDY2904139.1 hypothetical protein [Caecibacter massiliensis]NME28148.1 hypothetical protein [Megasphaera hexanoica]